jgi:hypothetical protein
MRTTIVLPPALLRAAKSRSAERGESLKALITRAVAAELAAPQDLQARAARVSLPLFGDPQGAKVRLTNRDLAEYLAAADAERVAPGRARRPVTTRRTSR